MGRLLLLTGLAVALLLDASAAAPQGHVRAGGGLLPPEDGSPLLQLLPGLKLLAAHQEGQEGAGALQAAEDVLGHLRSPMPGPEPDRDHQYHPSFQGALEQEQPPPRALLVRQVLRGPEPDRDHIHHAAGGALPSQGAQ
ncbi:PREDICTED: proline-rich acidic protein 1 [Condylura cristata]|uniref:proline-rich acidic protein 1 n=1 Tax=Condylura cristata TaxID=143302 RepID=UPI000643A36E|nr:PREDICTED: proline-rich acidic protein 1 [Condylura cristata]